ncbi:hypothetical protein ERJ75_001031100 [Trypanosoma vivax]|nr:hypothetical protein ERJ75_001031100 [Trypanosoma vivax]
MGACEARAEPLACGVGTAAAWSLPLDDTARQRLFGRVAGGQDEPSANGAAGEDACKGGPSELGVPTRGKVLTGRPCPRTAACGADGTRRAQTHGPARTRHGDRSRRWRGSAIADRPEAVARRSVRTRDRWLCAAWADRARGNAEGPASGRYRDLEGEGRGAAET